MRKTNALVSAALLLVAGQAAADNGSAVIRVGNEAGEASEFTGMPLPVFLIGTAVVVAAIVATSDVSESD